MSAFFWQDFDKFADRPCLFAESTVISYNSLSDLADDTAKLVSQTVGPNVHRPLILIEAENDVLPIALYLAALRSGWPVIIGGENECTAGSNIRETYQPNVVLRRKDGDWDVELQNSDQHDLNPELAVMLSTSGTTGAAKLVRLSRENIASNAASIATYLEAQPTDRAITTLPWHYSYGLSVLNVQLASGGSLVLTDHSITHDRFWSKARELGVTSLSLVPVQFEMLAAENLSPDRFPTLKYVTQAGGRFDPELAVSFHRQARKEGWKLFVMYGQTEASPRISYVPADAEETQMDSIGQAVPGGVLSLEDANGQSITGADTEGELIYRGPNVMMGYATAIADLAKGAELDKLATGDIAKRMSNGFFKIVGRSSRFVKMNGLRLSLDQIETDLRQKGLKAYCSGSDTQLVVFAQSGSRETYRDHLEQELGLSSSLYTIADMDDVPVLSSGKVDYKTLKTMALDIAEQKPKIDHDLQALLERVLRTKSLDMHRSFQDHGGDSLSYLEVQLSLQNSGAPLPAAWETLPLSSLLAISNTPGGENDKINLVQVPVDVLWRIAAIVAVMLHHTTDFHISGGAYLMLILSGFSLARFQSAPLFRGDILRSAKAMLGPILLGYFIIMGSVHFLYKPIELNWFLLLGNFEREITGPAIEPYWYVCAYAQLVFLSVLPFSLPSVRKLAAIQPFMTGMIALIGVFVLIDFVQLTEILPGLRIRHTLGAFELFLMGWCLHFATTVRLKSTFLIALIIVFTRHWAEVPVTAAAFMYFGLATILLGTSVKIGRTVANAIVTMAGLTMIVYLLHPIVQSLIERISMNTGFVAPATIVGSFLAAIIFKRLQTKCQSQLALAKIDFNWERRFITASVKK